MVKVRVDTFLLASRIVLTIFSQTIETDRRNSKLFPRLDLDEAFQSRIFDLITRARRWDGEWLYIL